MHDWGNYPGDYEARNYYSPTPPSTTVKTPPPEPPQFGKSNFLIEFYSNLTPTELRALINRALTEETKKMGVQGSRVSSFIVQECV